MSAPFAAWGIVLTGFPERTAKRLRDDGFEVIRPRERYWIAERDGKSRRRAKDGRGWWRDRPSLGFLLVHVAAFEYHEAGKACFKAVRTANGRAVDYPIPGLMVCQTLDDQDRLFGLITRLNGDGYFEQAETPARSDKPGSPPRASYRPWLDALRERAMAAPGNI